VVGQEVPGLLLIALVVVLIRLWVPRLRRIVDAEHAALAAERVTTKDNAEPTDAEHDRHHADNDPGTAITDQLRNSRA
jgi:hypothetical protein